MELVVAKTLTTGDFVHHNTRKNADGTPMRARVTSIKTWKRNPARIEIRYKRGMYEYGSIYEYELQQFSIGYGS